MSKRRRKLMEIGLLLLGSSISILVILFTLIDRQNYYHIKHSPQHFQLVKSNESESVVYTVDDLPSDDRSMLMNISNFRFLINNDVCSDPEPPLILAFVHSSPGNFKHRETIRETWGRDLKVVFLLGLTSTKLQKHVENEDMSYRDIVQGNFIDSYQNLTYKHIMGHKWVNYHCPGAKYILKTDDDVLVNVTFLKKYIRSKLSLAGALNLILCEINLTTVHRSYKSKWRVSREDFPGRWYPPFCNGWAILYSADVSFKLYSASRNAKYFWIDDVFVTGMLASQINVSLTPAFPFAIYSADAKRLLTKSYLDPEDDFLFCYPKNYLPEVNKLWRIISNTQRYKEFSWLNSVEVR